METKEKIILTALEPEDLELLYTIENDTEMWNIANTNVPYSRYDLRDYLTTQQHDIYADKQIRFVIRTISDTDRSENRSVGLIDLFDFSFKHKRAEMGVAILAKEQGKGYASEAIRLLQQYCKDTLDLHQIYCVVPITNKPSIAMLRKTGFTEEHILKDWLYSSNGWCDAVWTANILK